MKIRATMHHVQKGIRNFKEKYGDRLICVRYRYGNEDGRYMVNGVDKKAIESDNHIADT